MSICGLSLTWQHIPGVSPLKLFSLLLALLAHRWAQELFCSLKGGWETDRAGGGGLKEGLSRDRNENGHVDALFLCIELPYMIRRKWFFFLVRSLNWMYSRHKILWQCTSIKPQEKKINQKADKDRLCSPAYTASWAEKTSMNSKWLRTY